MTAVPAEFHLAPWLREKIQTTGSSSGSGLRGAESA
jgi:hypothetical protein